jgi:hypothetical protein
MVKYHCDVCKEEFQPTKLMNGESAFSTFNYFYKATTLVQGQMTPTDKVDPYMLCGGCGKELNEKVDEMKKKNEKDSK